MELREYSIELCERLLSFLRIIVGELSSQRNLNLVFGFGLLSAREKGAPAWVASDAFSSEACGEVRH